MARGKSTKATTRRRGAGKKTASIEQDVPDVYNELLVEVAGSSPISFDNEGRSRKRRRVGERTVNPGSPGKADVTQGSETDNTREATPGQGQNVEESIDEDEEFEDVNIEWEDAAAPSDSADGEFDGGDQNDKQRPLEIKLDDNAGEEPKQIFQRRKPLSAVERRLRLDIHKMHVLCLLAHVHLLNLWCNDQAVQV